MTAGGAGALGGGGAFGCAPLGAALAEHRSLETLSLWKNRLGASGGGAAFVAAMKLNGSLTCLDLRGNHLDDECGVALAGYLARRTKLATLLVSDNALLPAAAKALAKSWAENSVLTALDVRGNQLDADALKALKAARVAAAKKHAGTVELLVDEFEGKASQGLG